MRTCGAYLHRPVACLAGFVVNDGPAHRKTILVCRVLEKRQCVSQ
jgi:hypothetical protein